MKEKIKNTTNKFLIIILTFLLVIFSFISTSFASEFCFDLNNTKYTINLNDDITEHKYFFIYFHKGDGLWYYSEMFVSDYPIVFERYGDTLGYKFHCFNDEKNLVNYYYKISAASIKTSDDIYTAFNNCITKFEALSLTSFDCASSFYTGFSDNHLIISNYDIYDVEGNLLFPLAPPERVEQVTIPEIQQVAEIPQVMAQIMKILIPVGLIIFGIGLVIYLVRLLISRMT